MHWFCWVGSVAGALSFGFNLWVGYKMLTVDDGS
jgi:hypothetical protein